VRFILVFGFWISVVMKDLLLGVIVHFLGCGCIVFRVLGFGF
jgi:hypothetical protein